MKNKIIKDSIEILEFLENRDTKNDIWVGLLGLYDNLWLLFEYYRNDCEMSEEEHFKLCCTNFDYES